MFYIFYVSQLYLFLKMSFRKRFKYEVDAMNASTLRGDFLAAIYSVFSTVHLLRFLYIEIWGIFAFFKW